MSSSYIITDHRPIVLRSGFKVEIADLLEVVISVNNKFRSLKNGTQKMAFDIFKIIDFRMLSGLVGETLVTELSAYFDELERNPNIDGYPDLLDVSQDGFKKDFERWMRSDFGKFIKYEHGGIEVKNTFGTKKSGVHLYPGDPRIGKINSKLDWKAHHGYTNNLLALISDFVDDCPQIVAVCYADTLEESDWSAKQHPKEGSTMTSFCVISSPGCKKLKMGLKFRLDTPEQEKFFRIKT